MSETIANLRAGVQPWAWDAGVAALAAVLGVALGLIVYRMLFGVLRRIARSNETKSDDIIIEALARPARWALATLGHVIAARQTDAADPHDSRADQEDDKIADKAEGSQVKP